MLIVLTLSYSIDLTMRNIITILSIVAIFYACNDDNDIEEIEVLSSDSLIVEEEPIDTLNNEDNLDTLDLEETTPCYEDFKTAIIVSEVYKLRFQLKIPETWNTVSSHGIDSWIGWVQGPTDTLFFDFGFWGNTVFTDSRCEVWQETIFGYTADLCRPLDKSDNYAMRIRDVQVKLFDMDEYTYDFIFTMGQISDQPMDEETVLCIFRSFEMLCYADNSDCFFN